MTIMDSPNGTRYSDRVAVHTPVPVESACVFLEPYAVGALRRFEGIAAGSVNSNFQVTTASGRFFLRVYEEQDNDGASREAVLLDELAHHEVPTPAPLADTTGRVIGVIADKPAALFPWCDGHMRCQKSVTADDVMRVGEALARVHRAGAALHRGEGRFRYEDLLQRLDTIEASTELCEAAFGLRDKLATWTSRRNASLPRGLIHGDLFRDNVLWREDGALAALLDFESASDGVLVYDLMVTVLAWCVGSGLDATLCRALVAGYERVRPLSTEERRGLLAEGCVAALRFTITRITDYAMRATEGPRVIKDWRRFAMRLDALERLGVEGLAEVIG